MRKIIIGLGIVFVLLVVVVVVAVSNVNSYLAENRETLSGLASDAAGREVAYESAEVAFSGGLAVRVSGIHVAEDPRFGEPHFLSLDEAYVGVRILPALQQRIEVSGIRLDSPIIRVIQTADGFNFDTLGVPADAAPPEPAPSESESSAEEGAPLAVAIALLEIVDGTVYFEDRTSPEGLSLVIEDFETSGTDLALDGPISIDFSALVRSTKALDAGLETPLEGEIRLQGLDPLVGKIQLNSPILHPAIFGVRLEEGEAVEHIDSLEVGLTLMPDPSKSGYPVQIRSQEARLAGFDLDSIAIDVIYRDTPAGSDIKMDRVAIGLADGMIDLAGSMILGEPDRSPFDVTTKIRDLDSGKLAEAFLGLAPGMLSGKLGGDVALKGDSLEWESLKKSLAGTVSLDVGEGALEQVNVLSTFVDRLVADPGFGRLAADAIRDVAPEALQGDRTPFSGIDLLLEVADGAVQAKDLSMQAKDFAIQAAGRVGLDGAVAGDGTIEFSEALSKKIFEKTDEFGSFFGDGKTVSIPLQLGGTTAAPSLVPDLAAMSQKATAEAKRELTNRAAKELNKFLSKRRKKREGEETGEADSEAESTEDQIKQGLDSIFGR